MKTPEEISEQYWYAHGITLDKGVIKLIQNEAYNQALIDCDNIPTWEFSVAPNRKFVTIEDIEKLKK